MDEPGRWSMFLYRIGMTLRAPWCDDYIEPGCSNGWHCENCLVTPLLHREYWRQRFWGRGV